MGNLNGFHVDGSKLSSTEMLILEQFLKLKSWEVYEVAGEPKVYTAMFHTGYDPIPDNPFPDKCTIRKIK